MCGIAGVLSLTNQPISNLSRRLSLMNQIQAHRGPDGVGVWENKTQSVGLAHRRLSIIDLSTGNQPMSHQAAGVHLIFNGEIYNYIELRKEIGEEQFTTTSDTEVILLAYLKWGKLCLSRFRGMFSFAIYDERTASFFAARDRVGIKPFYYTVVNGLLYFASEIKTLLPFLPSIEADDKSIKDYFTFQFYLEGRTLFKDIVELGAGMFLEVSNGNLSQKKYWEVFYQADTETEAKVWHEKLEAVFDESVAYHCRADVPIGSYISGGIDSSLITARAKQCRSDEVCGFIGKFSFSENYDESRYAKIVANQLSIPLHEIDITIDDFFSQIENVIYHLDCPVAGPGAFSQYMVSSLAAKHRKVVLGGQGGDEIFGGYVRYLLCYLERCIGGAIDGTLHDGNFVVTYESIIPNLRALKSYQPMMKEFWSEGLFDSVDKRYFRLVSRAPLACVDWSSLTSYDPFEAFRSVFNATNVPQRALFDKMTHFDFKTLLPALLQIEDRVSMAHGLESRVPFLDHELIELAATAPAMIKFKGGRLKSWLLDALGSRLPKEITSREDKMGFPTPINFWANTSKGRDWTHDLFSSHKAKGRDVVSYENILASQDTNEYGRTLWGLLSFELWNRRYVDRAAEFKALAADLS